MIYRPSGELQSHYFTAELVDQFDAVAHIDRTRALEPLDTMEPASTDGELPETYPTGV
ncbi:MAG: hypothetical protein QOJ39_3604 [Candidatus Eremiobacteraeota bacterium]|nr:hypothetical protein [Candidatus Eremiobacteraeota bacterium]